MRHEARQVPSWLIFDVGQNMKAFSVIVALLALAVESRGAALDSWISEPPMEAYLNRHPVVPEREYYEVVASMRDNAEVELRKSSFVRTSVEQAKKYAGVQFECPPGKRPYLVRALYASAGTGRFTVRKFERAIFVLHSSLGSEFVISKSALVVNLDSDPAHVYVNVSVAR